MAAQVDTTVAIPADEIRLVIESELAERFLGFERRLSDLGTWLWRPKDAPASPWVDAPPNTMGTKEALPTLLTLLGTACHAQGLEWSIIYSRLYPSIVGGEPTPKYSVAVYARAPNEPQRNLVKLTHVDDLHGAIGITVIEMHGGNIHDAHRKLFPGRYLAGANDSRVDEQIRQ
jgi:hypothetical protein